MKLRIRDSKSLLDSIESSKKVIKDAEPDYSKEGMHSITNAFIERKDDIWQTRSFEDLAKVFKEVMEKFDSPKAREYKYKFAELERLYNRMPVKGSRNDIWVWDKLMTLVKNIILAGSGHRSPDVSKEQVKEELGHMMAKEDSCKDSGSPLEEVCKLLGEAHDKVMEALDLIEELENNGVVPSSLRYAVEDLEAAASALDFTGESVPVAKLQEEFPNEEEMEFDIYE